MSLSGRFALRVCDKRLLSAHERDSGYDHAVNHDEQIEREPTGDDGHEQLAEGADEREDVGSTYLDHAEYQSENGEADYDESEQYDDAQEYAQAPEDEADAREETNQFVTNDEPEPLLDADPTHKGSADLESTEYQERDDRHEEGEASGDAEVTSTITASTHANDTGFEGDELRVLTEVRDSVVTGKPQLEEIDGKSLSSMPFIVLFSAFLQNGKLSTQNIQVPFPVTIMGRSKWKPMGSQVCLVQSIPASFHLTECRGWRSRG